LPQNVSGRSEQKQQKKQILARRDNPSPLGGAGVGLFFIKFPLRLDPLQKNRKQNFGFL
jgi:hypothetical protein